MPESFPALVFGPELSPGGTSGSFSVSALGIEAFADGRSLRATLSEVTLREVGFGKRGVELAWSEGDRAFAVHVLDPIAAQRLLAHPMLASLTQTQSLRGKQRHAKFGRTIGWSLLALFVLLPAIILVALILNSNSIAGWIADRVPVEEEIRYGQQAFAGMRGQLKLKDEGPAYEAVKSIVARLTRESRYRYDVHVTQDDSLNAFAMPGGIVVVHTGLIAATTRPEELAGVLAHEVQHVELRHSLRGLIKELGLRGLWAYATGDLGGSIASQAALELTSLKFSRDDESEADERGFDALVQASIDPAGMADFFKTMSETAKGAPPAFLSTHPLSEERRSVLLRRLERLGEHKVVALDFGSWPPP